MSDIGERSTVNEDRVVFQCLNEIWMQGFVHDYGHGTFCAQITGCDEIAIARATDDDLGESVAKIIATARQAHDCHDFRCRGDVERACAGLPMSHLNSDIAKRTVV